MSHKVPKKLSGNETIRVPLINVELSIMGAVYNSIVSIITIFFIKMAGVFIDGNIDFIAFAFTVLAIVNIPVYFLGNYHINKKKFDGGGIRMDVWLVRKLKFKLFGGKIYCRLCDKIVEEETGIRKWIKKIKM